MKLTDQQRKEIRENKLGLNQTELAKKYKVCRATIKRTQENFYLQGTRFDRRIKLTQEDRKEIRENKSNLSQRALAEYYGVSRRTIQFTQDPKKIEQNKLRRAERGGSKIYYDKEKHTERMNQHRSHRKSIMDREKNKK